MRCLNKPRRNRSGATVAAMVLTGLATATPATAGTAAEAFNEGVRAYQAEDYREAERAFARAVDDARLGALAAWNLGRAAAARGDWRAAEHWWRRARDHAETPALRQRASERLAELEQRRPRGTAYVALAAGYDSNAPLEESGVAFEDRDGPFLEALASGRWQVSGARREGVHARGGLQAREYDDLDDFSHSDLQASIHDTAPVRVPRLGRWQRDLSVGVGRTRVGSESADTRLVLGAAAERPIPGSGWVDLDYRLAVHRGGSDREWLDGQQHRLRARYRERTASIPWGVSYALEWNNRDDFQGEDVFISHSPVRHRLRAFATVTPFEPWSLTARAEAQYVRYRDPNEIDGAQRRRRDTRWIAEAEADRPLAGEWYFGVRLRGEHFDSQRTDFTERSLERYDTNRVEVTAYIDRVF